MTARRRHQAGWLIAFAATLAPAGARADEPTQPLDCPTASEDGQRLREQLKYRAARDRFRSCSLSSCPALVRKDCVKWAAELEQSMPTVVVAVVDEHDRDMSEVELSLDGDMIAARVDGTPVAIDPGKHELRATSSGRVPTSVPVVVRVGEKNRLVHLKFAPKTQAAAAPTEDVAHAPVAPPVVRAPRRSYAPPVLSVVLGGVGMLGLGAFAALGVTSKSDLGVLRDTCAPGCVQSDVDSIKTRMILADVSLGVGVVGLGVGAALWVLSATKPAPRTVAARSGTWQWGAAPIRSGAAATLSATF